MKNHGFTLAEMLIALALIGIIAALLIPKLLSSTSNRQDVARVRSMVSSLERALNEGQSNPDSSINLTPEAFFNAEMNGLNTVSFTTVMNCNTTGATVMYFPDGSAFVINDSNTNLLSTTTAQAEVCIELNTRANTGDGYNGTFRYNASKARYDFDWAGTGLGGTQTVASILY